MRVDLPCAICAALLAAGCGKSPATPDGTGPQPGDAAPGDATPGDVPPHMPGTPGAAAHGLAYYKLADPKYPSNPTSISTPKLTTAASGSTIVVSVGRGDINKLTAATVTDTAGNAPYLKQGQHAYEPAFPDSGTALYTFTNAHGGSGFQVTTGAGQNSKGQLD